MEIEQLRKIIDNALWVAEHESRVYISWTDAKASCEIVEEALAAFDALVEKLKRLEG